MTAIPPLEASPVTARRRLRRQERQGPVLDGEFRFVAERPEPVDPIVFLYDLYERAAVPLGVGCVILGVAFAVIAVLLSGGALAHA